MPWITLGGGIYECTDTLREGTVNWSDNTVLLNRIEFGRTQGMLSPQIFSWSSVMCSKYISSDNYFAYDYVIWYSLSRNWGYDA